MAIVCLLPLLLALLAPAAGAAPLDSLLVKAATYADSNALAQARGRLDAIVSGKAPTPAAVASLATFFSRLRLYDEGVAAMRGIAPFCTNDVLTAVRREEGRALILSGRLEEGLALLRAGQLADELRNEITSAEAIQKVMAGLIVTDAVALRENLDACSRNATPGPAVLKLLRSQGDQIFLRDDGSGVDATEFVRQAAATWPSAATIQAALEADAEKAAAALPEGDFRKFGNYWRVYQGARPARQAAETLADRLLDDGRPDVAMAWYGRLLPFDGSARLIAKYAYARSLTSAPGSLGEWMKSLSATVRETMVNGNKALPLGAFVAGLPVKPPEPAVPPFPDGLKLAPGWKAPVLPSEGLRINRSEWFANRTAFARPISLPAVSGEAVFVNTGLSVRRYAADSGSNVWSVGFMPVVVNDREQFGATYVPFFPLPVFGAAVQDDLVVCRHAERITNAELLSSCGLTALDARTGALRWRTRDIPELAGWHVASEPCVDRGIVTFLIQGVSGETILGAVALEARTGTVLWNRILVMGTDLRGTDGRFAESYSSELPRPLSTARGVCFATHMGRTFLLDALTGAVLWMQPYPRVLADAGAPKGPMNPLLAVGGAIISAPYDSARIFALDAATGKPLWDEPTALDFLLGGVWKGRLVTFGRGLRLRDAKSGATVAAEPLAWKPSLPVGFVNGDRFWLADETEARLYDLTTLKETGAVAAGQRLLPAGGLAMSCSPNIISAFRLDAAASAPVAPPGRTVRARPAPVGGAKRDVSEPVGEVAPRLLWTVSIPGSFSLPDDDRGLALVYGLYNAKLIDTDGFGEPYWEYMATNILRKVVWTDETVVLATDVDLIGLDLATGGERWRQPTKYPLQALYAQGDLFVIGVTNDTEVLRVNPKDGGIRCRYPMPGNRVARAVRESGGRLHVELSPAAPNTGWSIQELGADGKLGRELCGNGSNWKDSIGFWDLGADRVYTSEGSTYTCWDLERKKMLWKAPYIPPGGQPITSKRVIASTPAGHPWWYLTSRDGNAVLDPLTGDVLYNGGGATWNSDVLEFRDYNVLKRLSLEPGKAPREAWKKTTFDTDGLRAIVWPESGTALRAVTVKYHYPFTPRLFEFDPATGKTLRNFMILPTGEAGLSVVWKYGNSRLFLASQQTLCAVAIMPVGGVPAWYAERRQAALRIGDPVGRARALRFVNHSEQLCRQAETRWIASAGPLVLDQPWQWVPAEEATGPRVKDWAGPADLSAKLTAAMTAASTLRLVVEVRDNTWVPMDGGKGDAVLIGKQVTFGLDSQYRPVIEPATPENLELLGSATVSHAGGNLLRYTIELPWNWRNAGACNASNTQFNLSFAIRDDDGRGVKGALEWARSMDNAPVRIEK
jgi:outer membrane protein assembly factor BamB